MPAVTTPATGICYRNVAAHRQLTPGSFVPRPIVCSFNANVVELCTFLVENSFLVKFVWAECFVSLSILHALHTS